MNLTIPIIVSIDNIAGRRLTILADFWFNTDTKT